MKTLFFILTAVCLIEPLQAQQVAREATASEVAAGTAGAPAFLTPRRARGIGCGTATNLPSVVINGTTMTYLRTNGTGTVDTIVTNLGTGKFTVIGGNGIAADHTLYVDALNGNNATAGYGLDKPSLTISNAVKLAQSGDLVFVLPGTYNENNLRKNGVNYYGSPGANIFYQHPTTNDVGWGVFDDRTVGACTNQIEWHGQIAIQGFTNQTFYGNAWYDNGYTERSPNFLGIVVQTNQNSILRGYIHQIYMPLYGCGSGDTVGLYMANGGDRENGSDLTIDSIICPQWLYVPVNWYDGLTSNNVQSIIPCSASGILWGNGDLHVTCPYIDCGTYSLWTQQGIGVQTNRVNHFHFDGDELYGKIYTVAANTNVVGWFHFHQLQPSYYFGGLLPVLDGNSGFITNVVLAPRPAYSAGNAVDFYGSGKWYLYFDKILVATNQNGIGMNNLNSPSAGVSDVWLHGLKIGAQPGATWASILLGQLHMDVFDLTGDGANGKGGGVIVNGGVLDLSGGTATGSGNNNAGIASPLSGAFLTFKGGICRIKNFTATNNFGPLVYANANGLTLQNVDLQAGSNAPAIFSTSTTNVSINFFGGNINAGITNRVTAHGYFESNNIFSTP